MEKEIGILCHISSLPSPYGVGDFGKTAYEFKDFLAENNIKIWQIIFLIFQNPTMTKYGIFEYVAKINFKMYT